MANCLYNGIKTPDINDVWPDSAIYPYAIIFNDDGILPKVFFSNVPMYVAEDGNVTMPEGEAHWYIKGQGGNFVTGFYDEWQKAATTFTGGNTGFVKSELLWSNHDVLNEDGTIYLSATTPISLEGQTVIEWDGVTEGLESTTYNGLTYYRVADGAPSIKQLKGGYTVVSSTSDELGTVLTTGVNAEYDYFEDGGIYGADPWLVKDGAVWLQRYTDGADEVQYISLLSYATVVADIDPVAFMTGFQLGQAIRGLLK